MNDNKTEEEIELQEADASTGEIPATVAGGASPSPEGAQISIQFPNSKLLKGLNTLARSTLAPTAYGSLFMMDVYFLQWSAEFQARTAKQLFMYPWFDGLLLLGGFVFLLLAVHNAFRRQAAAAPISAENPGTAA